MSISPRHRKKIKRQLSLPSIREAFYSGSDVDQLTQQRSLDLPPTSRSRLRSSPLRNSVSLQNSPAQSLPPIKVDDSNKSLSHSEPQKLRRSLSCDLSHLVFDRHPSVLTTRGRNQSLRVPNFYPQTVFIFSKNNQPLAIFRNTATSAELGAAFRAQLDLYRPIMTSINHQQTSTKPASKFDPLHLMTLSDRSFYELFHQLQVNQDYYQFQSVSVAETHVQLDPANQQWSVLIKDSHFQEVIPTADDQLLTQHFRHNYIRYLPIYQWFREQVGYPEFRVSSTQRLIEQLQSLPDTSLLKYLKNSESPDSPGRQIQLASCLVF